MPSETEVQLEIGHVLFIDIVGYSKALIDDHRALQQDLNDVVRNAEQFRSAEATGKLIRLPTGDGMALVFFTSPEAPLLCAMQVADALKSHPRLRVRMGINTGPVSGVADVNDRSNVAGAGINIAQRVMDLGDAGHILLSKRAAEDLSQYRRWEPYLHEIGEVEVKHGVRTDSGIVFGKNRPFAISVMTTYYRDESAIAEIALEAFRYFEMRGRTTEYGRVLDQK